MQARNASRSCRFIACRRRSTTSAGFAFMCAPMARSAPFLRDRRLLQVGEDLVGRPLARDGSAFHESLEIDRRVLAGEEAVALAHALIARDGLVLADLPVGVGEEEVGIQMRQRAGRLSVPPSGQTGE